MIGEVLAEADEEIYHRLASLVNGETITTYIDTGVIYPQIKKNPSTIYSFLLVTGYLKAVKTTLSFNGDFMCEISLPNREIALVYHKEILQKFETMIPQSTAIAVQEAIFSGDNRKLKTQIQTLLMESVQPEKIFIMDLCLDFVHCWEDFLSHRTGSLAKDAMISS